MPLNEKKEKEKPCNDNCNPGQPGESVESLMKNIDVCRSVGLEIINRTKTVTLKEFRWVPLCPLLLSATLPMRDISKDNGEAQCQVLEQFPACSSILWWTILSLHCTAAHTSRNSFLVPMLLQFFLCLYSLLIPLEALLRFPAVISEFLSLPAWGSQS